MTTKIAIYGAGAVGCTLAAHLFSTPHTTITLIGRGEHLSAITKNGLTYTHKNTTSTLPIATTNDPALLEPQDITFLTVKAHQLPTIATQVASLLHSDSIIIPICNGIPWWFMQGLDTSQDSHIPLLDPEKLLAQHIPFSHIIGGVVYMGAGITEAGHITNHSGPFLQIGAPSTAHQPHLDKIKQLLKNSNLNYSISKNIYSSILNKLCWNIAFNCLSIIHQKDCQNMAADPTLCQQATAIMQEINLLAASLNIPFTVDADKHIQSAQQAGHHKPSMLQDFEANKPLETDAILFAAQHLLHTQHIACPHIDELAQQLNHSLN